MFEVCWYIASTYVIRYTDKLISLFFVCRMVARGVVLSISISSLGIITPSNIEWRFNWHPLFTCRGWSNVSPSCACSELFTLCITDFLYIRGESGQHCWQDIRCNETSDRHDFLHVSYGTWKAPPFSYTLCLLHTIIWFVILGELAYIKLSSPFPTSNHI